MENIVLNLDIQEYHSMLNALAIARRTLHEDHKDGVISDQYFQQEEIMEKLEEKLVHAKNNQ